MLTVDLLGDVEARRDGTLLAVPMGKTTELLARLALEASRPVRTDVLLDDLWGGAQTARNTLQSKVSQLRRALGDRGLVHASSDGYRLALDPAQVDVHRVTSLAAEASRARDAHDAAAAVAITTEALALFRGEALLGYGDWAAAHRAQLAELRLTLQETAMDARASLGAGGELIADLEILVGRDPLRERLWGILMTALYRAGRQADALATYQRVRDLLDEELGVEPGPELQSLQTRVLQHDAALGAWGGAAESGMPGNLSPRPMSLIGRAADLDALAGEMDEHRLVCIVGPGGVGKTALAIAVGQRRHASGGVWLVRLEGVDSGADLGGLVAGTMHVPGGEQGLQQRLTGAQTLLILDNCEHLTENVAALLTHLLAAVPTLRVLLTSQVALGIDDERIHHLVPLAQADAETLFTTRARALRDRFGPDQETARLVSEIVRSLDGLPLAIELAAARIRSMSVRDIARRLDDRFTLLRDPSSNRPERRRALAGAIGWSYDLLFPDDQRALWALSTFAGGATLDALEQVMHALAVPVDAAMDAITRLVDRSLVEVDTGPDDSVRYRLLDSIRAYASARLDEAGLTCDAQAAHAMWYASSAAWCKDHVRTEDQARCLAIARAERANIDVALAWCRQQNPPLGAEIAVGMGWTWVVLGDGAAGAARIRRAIDVDIPTPLRLSGQLIAGWLEASAGNLDLAGEDLDAARALAEDLDDDSASADVDRHQAFVALQQGRPDLAMTFARSSLERPRHRPSPWDQSSSLILGAYGALQTGDSASAAHDASVAVAMLAGCGDAWAQVHAQALLGVIAEAEGRLSDAANALREAAEASRVLGFPGQMALHLASLAQIEHRSGRDAEAVRTFQQALAAAHAGADGRLAATARLHLALLLRGRGAGTAAVPLLQENADWYAQAGGGDGALLTRCLLHAETGDRSGLAEDEAEALATGNVEVQVYVLDAQARHAAQSGDPSRTQTLMRQADNLAASASGTTRQDRWDRRQAERLLARERIGR